MALLIISCTAHAIKTVYDYGCQGSISITVGQEKTLYQSFPSFVWNCKWYLRSTRNNISVDSQEAGGAKIVSSTNSSCTIKGVGSTNSDTQLQLYCEHKGYSDDSDEYVCYFNVTVKDILITSITLNPSSVALNVGDTQRVTYTKYP